MKRVYSKEQAEKLRNFLPFTSTDFPYVPEAFKEAFADDKDLWPVFILRPKTGIQSAKLEDEVVASMSEDGNQEIKVNSGKIRIKTLKSGIINIKNWFDSEGKEIKMKRGNDGKIDDSILEKMHPELQIEIMNAITENSTLTEEELEGLKY